MSPAADQIQWNSLATRFLALGPLGRFPYVSKTFDLDMTSTEDTGFPSTAQINRALRPFQTVQERNACANGRGVTGGSEHPIWLRTCYDSTLQDRYNRLHCDCEVGDGFGVDDADVFDNESLYAAQAADSDHAAVQRLLLRAPGLADVFQYTCLDDDEYFKEINADEADESTWETEQVELQRASKESKWLLYLIDEEVLRSEQGLVKMLWMDVHGQCVWENKIFPTSVGPFRGALADSRTLIMHVENQTSTQSEDDTTSMWQRGAVFG